MCCEDENDLRPDAIHTGAEAEAARIDGQIEGIGDDDARQKWFAFGTYERCNKRDRADGEYEEFLGP